MRVSVAIYEDLKRGYFTIPPIRIMYNLSVSRYKSSVCAKATIKGDGKWSILSDPQSESSMSQKPKSISHNAKKIKLRK